MAMLAGVLASGPPARIAKLSSHEVTLTCAGDVWLGCGTPRAKSGWISGIIISAYHGIQERLDNGRKLVRAAIVGANQMKINLTRVCAFRQVQLKPDLAWD